MKKILIPEVTKASMNQEEEQTLETIIRARRSTILNIIIALNNRVRIIDKIKRVDIKLANL
jgi:hypothetical protein